VDWLSYHHLHFFWAVAREGSATRAADILHLLGLDHKRLTYKHAGRDFRLTDVHGEVVKGILV
jgi:hypothetical protein